MRIGNIRGLIDRRILLNYRVDPRLLASLLPRPFRPKLVRGAGMAGICLIRLKSIRPNLVPEWLGISSENAAHRVAVEWDEGDEVRNGVYIRRRDTNSWLNALAGGRLFPGRHHHARFRVQESAEDFAIEVHSDDDPMEVTVHGHTARQVPGSSVFASLDDASEFFASGSLGYSAALQAGRMEGLELRCWRWQMEPLSIEDVRSSFFDDHSLFPSGTIEFDSAFLMRGIPHEWQAAADLCGQT